MDRKTYSTGTVRKPTGKKTLLSHIISVTIHLG